jgi:hypothetical protein
MSKNGSIKKRSGQRRALLLPVAALVALAACTQERQPCLTPATASLNVQCIHLLSDTSVQVRDTALPRAILAPLTATGPQYRIYNAPSSLFVLSLSPVTDSCQWLFTTDSLNQPFDTISFSYARKLQFISNACGYATFFTLKQVHSTHFNIDSILLNNTDVTNDVNTRQLKIYIHPDF